MTVRALLQLDHVPKIGRRGPLGPVRELALELPGVERIEESKPELARDYLLR